MGGWFRAGPVAPDPAPAVQLRYEPAGTGLGVAASCRHRLSVCLLVHRRGIVAIVRLCLRVDVARCVGVEAAA
jgi:hypothetical protein